MCFAVAVVMRCVIEVQDVKIKIAIRRIIQSLDQIALQLIGQSVANFKPCGPLIQKLARAFQKTVLRRRLKCPPVHSALVELKACETLLGRVSVNEKRQARLVQSLCAGHINAESGYVPHVEGREVQVIVSVKCEPVELNVDFNL